MNISFIGSGNVATHLAQAFYARNHIIKHVWSRNMDHASQLATRVKAVPIDCLSRLSDDADVYIIAVSDDALPEVAKDVQVKGALVMHTSGATDADVLKGCSSHYGVLWSPQTFVRTVAMEYGELPFCIEGCDNETEVLIADFAQSVSPHIYRTNLVQRRCLHLSAVFVNNFPNALYAVAQQLCSEHDVPFEILYPLAIATTKNLQQGDVRLRMTGPAVRGDLKTINAHREFLSNNKMVLELYDRLTNLVTDISNL